MSRISYFWTNFRWFLLFLLCFLFSILNIYYKYYRYIVYIFFMKKKKIEWNEIYSSSPFFPSIFKNLKIMKQDWSFLVFQNGEVSRFSNFLWIFWINKLLFLTFQKLRQWCNSIFLKGTSSQVWTLSFTLSSHNFNNLYSIF
jgi:hypothetical protein